MAIYVNTDDSQGLLDSIYAAIDEGSIQTWAYDEDKDILHDTSDGQWEGEAWLHPTVGKSALVLNVIPPTKGVSMEAYAVYHGRFIEMLLAHFDEGFSEAFATARATGDDRIN
jgi:hypothetical protein